VPQKEGRKFGLSRALSKLGYCSRAKAAELIRAGRVRLNGNVRRDPETPVRLERDRITIDSLEIKPQKKVYLMMNKPRGLVTTASDEKGRETVYDALENAAKSLPWVAPVGRLDRASEGLLLLTNDSQWGARVIAPDTHLPKTYHVQIASVAGEQLAKALTAGVESAGVKGERETRRAVAARVLRSGEKNCWLEITLDEGKNRQIRRMLAAFGVEVLRLVRVAIGPLQLGKLPKGAHRTLTPEERHAIDGAMGMGDARSRFRRAAEEKEA